MRSIIISREAGHWIARYPSIPNLVADGETISAAVKTLGEMEAAFEASLREDGLSVPVSDQQSNTLLVTINLREESDHV